MLSHGTQLGRAKEVDDEPLVSVVIPTYNSSKTISRCLQSIASQSYKNVEVIIVDRLSTDQTQAIARLHGAKLFCLALERTAAKNFGANKATGVYVCFVDSDMELSRTVIEECVALAQKDEKIGAVIIPEQSIGTSYWAKVRRFERTFYLNTPIESARFFRRTLLDRVGFDDDVVFYEESTLPQKIRALGFIADARSNAMISHNEDDFSLLEWLRSKFHYGGTFNEYQTRYSEYASRQTDPLYRLGLFVRKKRFYTQLSLAAGVVTLKLLEYSAVRLGCLAKRTGSRVAGSRAGS